MLNPYYPADNQFPDLDTLGDNVWDFACEEFKTETPTDKQLDQAEKEYTAMLEEYEHNND